MDEPKQYYTVDEANAQLAELRQLFGRVMQIRTQLKSIYSRLEDLDAAPSQAEISGHEEWDDGDEQPDIVRRDKAVFRALVETLREHVEEIHETGCIIKDIETGLVDWYSLHDGREVFLCWRYGEHEVAHWHELEGGFSGRRPVEELALAVLEGEGGPEAR